jgi:hypothetical protein
MAGTRSEILGGQGRVGSLNPCGYVQLTLSTSPQVLTSPAANIERILLRISGGKARWRDDHVDPTSTVGFPILQDEGLILDSGFSDLRFIKDTSAGGTVILDALFYN